MLYESAPSKTKFVIYKTNINIEYHTSCLGKFFLLININNNSIPSHIIAVLLYTVFNVPDKTQNPVLSCTYSTGSVNTNVSITINIPKIIVFIVL